MVKKAIIKIVCFTCVLALCAGMFSSCALIAGQALYEIMQDGGANPSPEGDQGDNSHEGDEDYQDSDKVTLPSGNFGQDNSIVVEGGDADVKHAAAKGLLSSVSIKCAVSRSASVGEVSYSSAGSGVIYKIDKKTGNALIITNYHVLYSSSAKNSSRVCDVIHVFLYGSENQDMVIEASYVGGSMYYDIAVLYVENSEIIKSSDAQQADIGDSDKIFAGQIAIAIGNPEDYGISVTKGIISTQSEYISMTSVDGSSYISLRVVRVDTAVNSGNSGGGLFDDRGRLIGIVNAKSAQSGVENIGYAIPVNVARAVADNIIYYCSGGEYKGVMRAILGISVNVDSSKAHYDSESGLVYISEVISVVEVTKGSLADGVFREGDRLVSITLGENTAQISRQYHVIDLMLDARAGDTVSFEIERGSERTTVQFVITEECLTEY